MIPKVFAGLILNVEVDLLGFQIDGIDRFFYAGKWVAFHDGLFPNEDDMVLVSLCEDPVHMNGDGRVIVLCERCEVDFDKQERVPEDHLFLSLIRKYKLGNGCFLRIHKLHHGLKEFIEGIGNAERATIGIMEEVLRTYDEAIVDNFKEFSVKPISRFKSVDDRNVNYRDLDHFWTYGVQQKLPDNDEYIFGYVTVGSHGITVLRDTQWWIPVSIFQNKSIRGFVNRFVLIRKGSIITEVYNTGDVYPLSCLLMDADDVIPINSLPKVRNETIIVIDEKISTKYTTTFTLLHAGPVCVGRNETEQCWLQGYSEELGNIFVVLEGLLISARPLISANQVYTILHDEQRFAVSWNEIQRLDKNHLPAYVFKSPSTRFFAHGCSKGLKPILLDINEAEKRLESGGELVNITGLILNKTFCSGNQSFYGGKRHRQPFGTPGDKTHKIHLKSKNGDLTVFLNDFNRYVIPFGLLPNMVVNIYRVMPQKRGYYKCTALTTFELVRWNVVQCSSSANLNRTYRGIQNVEEKVFLSLPQTLLSNAIFFTQLKIVTVKSGYLAYLWPSETLEINLNLECKDEFGRFSLALTTEKTLKALLGFSSFPYKSFCKAFEKVGTFRYPSTEVKKEPRNEIDEFKYALNAIFECWHYCIFDIPVYVRKADTVGSVPLYTTVDV